MSNENLKMRTKKFGLNAIALVEVLPRDRTCDVLGRQLLRSATSVGANYRAACRAKSPADFIYKMGIVEEEADESGYWMEMLVDSGKVRAESIQSLLTVANELVAITVASINTARKSSTAVKMPRGAANSALRTPHSALRG
jgi:four helix bundle protein